METPKPTFTEKDATMLLAALQNTKGPIIVDKTKLAAQLNLAEKTISNQFSRIKKEYKLEIQFSSVDAGTTPKKPKAKKTTAAVEPEKAKEKKSQRNKNVEETSDDEDGQDGEGGAGSENKPVSN